MAKKSYRKPLNESAAALEQQGKINSLINGDTNYPAESPTNEPPFSAISSPSHTPTLAISCPHCHRPLFLSFCVTPTLE